MKQPKKISQLIDKNGLGELIPKRPIMPSTYQYLKQHNPEHHIVKDYEKALFEYEEYEALKKNTPELEEEKVILKPAGVIDINELRVFFYKAFHQVNKITFNPHANDGEANRFLYTLLYYFSGKDNFFRSDLLYRAKGVTPDLKKGLLVIGGFGCGKTSIFKAFHYLFKIMTQNNITIQNEAGDRIEFARYNQFYKYFTANQIVEDYEVCKKPEEKEHFWNMQNNGRAYYDDILTEREASNYGKAEIFKDVLEKRYERGSITFLSCNFYKRNDIENVDSTLWYFGKKYGGRVYDRLFSMVNIIELKGKSLR